MDAPMTSPYPRPPWPGPMETSFLGVPPARPSPKSDGGMTVGMRACSDVERGRTRTVEPGGGLPDEESRVRESEERQRQINGWQRPRVPYSIHHLDV